MADDFISNVFNLTRAEGVSCCAAIMWSERGGYFISVFHVYFHSLHPETPLACEAQRVIFEGLGLLVLS
mgnify:CR=1 FL=1